MPAWRMERPLFERKGALARQISQVRDFGQIVMHEY